ncbi:hypothetical protein STSO111631_16430 [Stackebrandtia soli]
MFGVIVRGIRHRPGRSLIVFVLAMCATAAAVMMPAYTTAARHSLLLDELRRLPSASVGLRLAGAVDASADPGDTTELLTVVDESVGQNADLAPFSAPITFTHAEALLADAEHPTGATIAYRDDVCDNIVMIAGECETTHSQLLMSKRSADALGLDVGDELAITSASTETAARRTATVVGVYLPADPDDGYWGRTFYFRHGAEANDTQRLDAFLVTDPAQLGGLGDREAGIEYRLDIDAINLDNIDQVVAAVARMDAEGGVGNPRLGPNSIPLDVQSSLPSVVERVAAEQEAVSRAVPIVAVPLLLLCWFVLYLVVARLTSERAEQIGLAKLRGHRLPVVALVGSGEAVALIIGALLPGALLGLGGVALLRDATLAPGSAFDLGPVLLWSALAALIGALSAVVVGALPVLDLPVARLLRRVRRGRKLSAGMIEGVVIALAGVALWQLLSPGGDSTIGLLVTPLLALVLGIVLARLMAVIAARRLKAATRRGALAEMIAMAQLSRRGESRRIVLLVTVAVALLAFGVCAWDIADRNRGVVASDTVGADSVYRLTASDPARMIDAVERLDPEGNALMAVVRSFERYRSSDFTVLAAQTDRLASVGRWRAADISAVASDLHPSELESLWVKKKLRVDVSDAVVDADRPAQLIVRIVNGQGEPATIRLGELVEGDHRYRGTLDGCGDGCRLVGVGVARYPGDLKEVHFDLTVESIADDTGVVADLTDCANWARPWHISSAITFNVDCAGGLRLEATTSEAKDLVAEHSPAPSTLPVLLAGDAPTGTADGFTFPAPHGDVAQFRVAAPVDVVPRGGTRAMVVDLGYANRMAESVTSLADRPELSYEIWATSEAPDNMVSRLAAEGLFVSTTETHADETQRLSRAAPALALNLYLVAASAALILVAGAMLMAATSSASSRGTDLATLAVAGVPGRVLRTATVREQLYWMIVPTLAGAVGGLAGLALVLPHVALVTTAPLLAPVDYRLGVWWPVGAGVVALVVLASVTAVAVRTQLRHGDPSVVRRSSE